LSAVVSKNGVYTENPTHPTLAIDWGYLDQNPCKGVKRFAEEPFRRTRVLTEDEEIRLFQVKMPCYLGSMLRIFLNTGLRRQELLKLSWGDVDFKNRQIYVRETKTQKSRYIPMNEIVYSELMKFYKTKKSDSLVFINQKTGNGFVCIRKVFERARERAGIKNLLLKDLRRTFATRLLSAGVDVITIQHLLGHGSIETTLIYTMTNQDEKRRAVSRLEPKNGPNLSRICPTEESETEKYILPKHFISMN
jgi:integrase/recombinase XerC/integrase/recombinase XerD